MKQFRKLTCALLALVMVLTMLGSAGPLPARAEETAEYETMVLTDVHINPLYAHLISPEEITDIPVPDLGSGTETVDVTQYDDTIEEVGLDMRAAMKNREETFSLYYVTDHLSQLDELMPQIRAAAFAHTGVPNEGDYIKWHFLTMKSQASVTYPNDGSLYYYNISTTVGYFTTANQEAEVDAAVEELLDVLDVYDETDYAKVKAVYDYICENVVYDHDHVGDTEYKLQQSTYGALINGTSVCQGYASLFYRLALELEVDNRLIPGTTNDQTHGWNIAKLNDLYYNLDATFDAQEETYSYFLVSPDNFPRHDRDEEYDNDEFHAAYPMASEDFDPADAGCNHAYGDPANTATCTERGIKTYTCTKCRETKEEASDPLGHNYATTVTYPNCTEEGFTTYDCTRCDYSYEDNRTEALDHTGGTASCSQLAVCTVCGESYGELLSHEYAEEWSTDAENHWYACENCNATTQLEAHDPNVEAATEESDKHCTVCGYVMENQVIHVHVTTLVEAAEATCTEPGNIAYYTCTCGKWFADAEAETEITDKTTVEIDATGHSTELQGQVDATETTDGYTGDLVCTVCKEVIEQGQVIPATASLPVAITEENFPDENFRRLITSTFDSDGDGYVSRDDRKTTVLHLEDASISSLQGIEYFGDLEVLYCGSNYLTSLNLSGLTKLEELHCESNQLTSLNVSNSPALKILQCQSNKLTTLNVSGNPALEQLHCASNQLTQLDLSNNPALKELYCASNQLTRLNFNDNILLETLSCASNQLTSLDVTNCTLLKKLYCSSNQLASLDLANNIALTDLYCQSNKLTKLNVSKNTSLQLLLCYSNQLVNLDVSSNTALTRLECYSNQLTALNVSKNSALKQLLAYSNQLASLDVSNCAALEDLSVHSNLLTGLDVTRNPKLTQLNCASNQITSLDLSSNPLLKELDCSANRLTSLDVSNCSALTTLTCENNACTISLDAAKTFDLTTLPGNFQAEQASNWTNADLSENILTVVDITAPVTYEYACGSEHTATFTLNPVDEAHSHTGGNATCENQAICEICGEAYGELAAHTWDEGDVTTEPSEAAPGVCTYTCTVCGETQTEEIPYVPAEAIVQRVAGDTRVETAIKAADVMKAELGVEKFSDIIVASGSNFADALAGSYLAVKKEAPILLSLGSNEANLTYIQNNLEDEGTVYILGGNAAVEETFEAALAEIGIPAERIQRLAGNSRFDTNLLILEEAGIPEGEEILIAKGWDFADCLSASATGKPILLVNTNTDALTETQITFLQAHASSQMTIIGGTASVSETLEAAIDEIAELDILRLSGAGREETSVLVAQRYFSEPSCAVLAYSLNYPDGLCGGPLAYRKGAPLLLARSGREDVVAAYIEENAITQGYIMGGSAAIEDETAKQIFGLTSEDPIPNA